MTDIVFRQEVLKLNKMRVPMDLDTPEKALGDLLTFKANEHTGEYILDDKGRKQRKMRAFWFDFEQREDGTYNYSLEGIQHVTLLDGDQWLEKQPRPFDLVVNTPHRAVCIPRAVLCLDAEEMNDRVKYSVSYNHVYDLYEGVCQYSGRKLKREEGSRDHRQPLSRGGKDVLENILLADKEINNWKGNRLNSECGLPDKPSKLPKKVPKFVELRRFNQTRKIPEWSYFLGE